MGSIQIQLLLGPQSQGSHQVSGFSIPHKHRPPCTGWHVRVEMAKARHDSRTRDGKLSGYWRRCVLRHVPCDDVTGGRVVRRTVLVEKVDPKQAASNQLLDVTIGRGGGQYPPHVMFSNNE